MTDETYSYIWEEIIKFNICKLLDSIGDSYINEFKIKVSNEKILKYIIYEEYKKKRARLKELYHYDNGDIDRKIDSHKIAACFAAVLIEEKVFSFEIKEGLTDDIFLLNARLAYNVSIDIIRMTLISHYMGTGKAEIANKILAKSTLYVPCTSNGHDEYNHGREKTILLNDVFGNEFDILTYSDMMFWIEFYNRQIYENEIEIKM